MRVKACLGTDIGRKRQQNQDSGASNPELGLFVVADGMGGHRGGETASAMVTEIVPRAVRDAASSLSAREVLTRAIVKANESIFERAQAQTELLGMGTTTTALLFREEDENQPLLTIGHVGDSRCYFLRPGAIWQLTRDHSLVQEKLRAGLITRAEVKTDSMKNVITRSVGFEKNVNVDTYEFAVQSGDVFLVCSDGLSGLIDENEILDLVQTRFFQNGDIDGAVKALIDLANAHGGDDNITAILVQIQDGPAGSAHAH